MRGCPVCECPHRTLVFSMDYKTPDGWTLPSRIDWLACDECGMIYGDGDFDQSGFDTYYRERYGYGVNNPANVERLLEDARSIAEYMHPIHMVVDFGGSGDDGKSVLVDELDRLNRVARCVNVGEPIPPCNVIYASHVLEHIYNLPDTMHAINDALVDDGLLIIDVPDATGLLLKWKMPILDYNTKHLNHFTLRNLLDLARYHGFELVKVKPYELEFGPCYQAHFRRLDVALASSEHIEESRNKRLRKLEEINEPVNIWGLGDVTWNAMTWAQLDVIEFIDNDPAFRGATYNGKPVQERPTNDSPIVILAQGQRQRLIANIRAAGIQNSIIEI